MSYTQINSPRCQGSAVLLSLALSINLTSEENVGWKAKAFSPFAHMYL